MGKSQASARSTLVQQLGGRLEMALHSRDPAFAAGMSDGEVSYPGYARQPADQWRLVNRPASVAAELAGTVSFPAATAVGETVARYWSVGVGDERRYTGKLDEPIVITHRQRPEFRPGDLVIDEL